MSTPASRLSITPGTELPRLVRTITQEGLHSYADASGDHNPLHVDPDFAARTQFGGTIAHGMLVLAFISEMLTAAFGRDWAESGRLKARLRAPARPGDTLNTSGRIVRVEGHTIACEVECSGQGGEPLVTGSAEVVVR